MDRFPPGPGAEYFFTAELQAEAAVGDTPVEAAPATAFEALREAVFALGGPFAPEAIRDDRVGLLGYMVVSVAALRAASNKVEADLTECHSRRDYSPPTDQQIGLVIQEQAFYFASQLA